MTLLNTPSTSHSHHHPRKPLTPALSTLLSSTTISRKRRPSFQPLSFPKQAVHDVAGHQPQQSRIKRGLGKNTVDQQNRQFYEPSTNLAIRLHAAPTGQLRNDLVDPLLEDQVQQDQLFSMDYAVKPSAVPALDEPVLSPTCSKPLWQILQEEEEEDDDDVSSSFSSISSTLSSSCTSGSSPNSIAMPRLVTRKSLSVLRSGNRMVASCSEFSSVDDASHPLSKTAPASSKTTDEEEDSERVTGLGRSLSLVSAISARFKALKSAATSFSQAHQALVASTAKDVFTFSPRSTDECAPAAFCDAPVVPIRSGRGMTMPAVRRRMANQSAVVVPKAKPQPTVTSVEASASTATTTDTPAPPAPPKVIALSTFSVQEYMLPPSPRLRSIRENGDFLRVYALEGLMRQSGKLDPGFEGKACVALVPRSDSVPEEREKEAGRRFPKYKRMEESSPSSLQQSTTAQRRRSKEVPARWIGVSVNDL